MDTSSEVEGKGEMNGENSLEAYILTYVKEITNGNLLYDAGSSNPGSCDNLEGGTHVYYG